MTQLAEGNNKRERYLYKNYAFGLLNDFLSI